MDGVPSSEPPQSESVEDLFTAIKDGPEFYLGDRETIQKIVRVPGGKSGDHFVHNDDMKREARFRFVGQVAHRNSWLNGDGTFVSNSNFASDIRKTKLKIRSRHTKRQQLRCLLEGPECSLDHHHRYPKNEDE